MPARAFACAFGEYFCKANRLELSPPRLFCIAAQVHLTMTTVRHLQAAALSYLIVYSFALFCNHAKLVSLLVIATFHRLTHPHRRRLHRLLLLM